jgi:hypothetical protein
LEITKSAGIFPKAQSMSSFLLSLELEGNLRELLTQDEDSKRNTNDFRLKENKELQIRIFYLFYEVILQ